MRSPRPEPDPAWPTDVVSVEASGTLRVASADGRRPGRGACWVLRNVVLGPVVTRLFRLIEEGAANVPAVGGAILASNHLSYADWLFTRWR